MAWVGRNRVEGAEYEAAVPIKGLTLYRYAI